MRRVLAIAGLVVTAALPLPAQEVSLDHTLEVAGVTLFASRTDPHSWYYLPDEPHVARTDSGEPEFSLVKYTATAEASGGGTHGVTAARGGGVLHMLAGYRMSPERLQAAAEALVAEPERRDDRIIGPVTYRSGTFALVSAVANPEGGMARRLVGAGPAPLLEGGKIAVSVELNPDGASYLWQAFEMATPDVSLVFSMQMEGYRTPYEADLVVDWDKAWTNQKIEARVKYMWIGAEVESLIDDLVTSGAVRVEVKGESTSMEKLLNAAYGKVMALMFDPMPSAQQPAATGGVGDMMKAILEKAKTNSPVDLFAGYKLTQKRMAGKARIRLRQQRAEPLFVLLTGNVGPLAEEWGDDPRFFRAINLEDPAFRQREVSFSFDGDAADFGRVVNHLVVQLRKRHADGKMTVREAVLEPDEIGTTNRVLFAYSNSGDDDLAQWMAYEWRAVWNFRGGRTHDTGWQETDAFAVALRPPFAVRRLLFDGEPEVFEEAGVRSVLARVEWDFLGQHQSERLTLRQGAWSEELELVLPAEDPACSVFLQWHLRGGRTISRGPWNEESDVVYIDEIPDETEGPVAGGEE